MRADGAKIQARPTARRGILIVLVVSTVVMVALCVTLVVMYTDPIKSVQRTEIDWFGATFATQSDDDGGPPFLVETSMLSYYDCPTQGAIGNATVSFVWQSSSANTSASLVWAPGGGGWPNSTIDHFYLSNDSRSGGYTVPQDLATMFCPFPPVYLRWVTPTAAEVTLSGFRAYNYTATEPIW